MATTISAKGTVWAWQIAQLSWWVGDAGGPGRWAGALVRSAGTLVQRAIGHPVGAMLDSIRIASGGARKSCKSKAADAARPAAVRIMVTVYRRPCCSFAHENLRRKSFNHPISSVLTGRLQDHPAAEASGRVRHMRCFSGYIVNPWIKIVNATTQKATSIASRHSATITGRVGARTGTSAPRFRNLYSLFWTGMTGDFRLSAKLDAAAARTLSLRDDQQPTACPTDNHLGRLYRFLSRSTAGTAFCRGTRTTFIEMLEQS